MWICLPHKRENRQQMEKFKDDLLRRGLNLACITHFVGFNKQPDAFAQAVKKMKNDEKKKKVHKRSEIVPVPEGEPLFLFHAAQGKTRAVNTFYDTGCSHAVLQADNPFTELKAQLVAKGPFNIGGVGGLVTK